jgi:hypothetical protein
MAPAPSARSTPVRIGLAGAEFTPQFDHAALGAARRRRPEQARAQRLGRFSAVRDPRVALVIAHGFIQPRNSASTSLAIRPR